MSLAAGCNMLRACRKCRPPTKVPRIISYSSQPGDGASLDRSVGTQKSGNSSEKANEAKDSESEELGPLARRLQEATEEALFTGGRAGRQAVQDAGFSEELKEKLMSKIQGAKFENDFAEALAEAGVTSKGEKLRSGSFGTQQAWAGEERTEDAVLRMLDDAKKPLKPELRGKPIDTRLKRGPVLSPGQRAASARDRASAYSGMGMKGSPGLSAKEKEEMRRQFRERFEPEGRIAPASISAIASMANERIEDAIARGQFKNIPRGKGAERDDSGASNPFVETTEYLMNRLIQRQDLVPPWIEKQQQLVREADAFRARLRSDWKRHAARLISSEGGTLAEQVGRAERYAAAERAHNPQRRRTSDQMAVSAAATDDPVMGGGPQPFEPAAAADVGGARPFRDPAWEAAEAKYMTLAVERLNALTRGYNLMAPELARKPYFSLERELATCYATVAPLVAGEIRNRGTTRATGSSRLAGGQVGTGGGSTMTGTGDAKIHVEGDDKAFGLKEWWRDFWKK